MEKIITILLNSEEDAFKASQEIKQLSQNENLTVNELYVLTRNENGEIQIKNAKDETLPYSASGALAGSFIGILGGPLGVLFGMTTGLLAGSLGDLVRASKSSKFLEKTSKSIPTGKTAIVANIDEYWEIPLNSILKPFSAEVKRLNVNEEIEKYINEEAKEIDDEINEFTAKLESAAEDDKAKIDARIAELKAKQAELHQNIKANAKEEKKSVSEWFGKVKNNFSNWRADIADKFDDSKEELIDDYEDLQEDYNELSVKIKRNLKNLENSTEESFRKSIGYVKEEIEELDEDIHKLEEQVDQLVEKDKERWQLKLENLKLKRDELLAKAKSDFEAHREKYQEWLSKTENDLKSN
ncbi:DUF1269 domain-containing protein [Elizabethkingia anophelis]|uniref:DUF1269 domain-containing protein n=1 Tax=Chryseobacterium indologenes TaxID=253 RepID=A0A0N0IXT3_CHRID|nr:DUF1269 domain-containing protein [Chryseobacterium indologenes]KPE52551.1 hypothetical protein AOB46_00550 [Chryseobacterium indologenes]MDV3734000.1 DUF1269 domain-containing protein [Elizabethkingia anophelis]